MSACAYSAFERDVPEALRERAMEDMASATSGWGDPENVHILECDRIDAINCRAHGIITIQGEEYTFQMEDGNHNGTVLLAWESDEPFEHHKPMQYALQPRRDLIADAIATGKGPFLIFKWDALLKNRPKLAEIPGKYAYDIFVQPGGRVSDYWRKAAAEHQFDLVTQEEADETRKRLEAANDPEQAQAFSQLVNGVFGRQ